MLDTGCWIAAVFYPCIIQLNDVDNNDNSLNKIGIKQYSGFHLPASSIQNPASRMSNYYAILLHLETLRDL